MRGRDEVRGGGRSTTIVIVVVVLVLLAFAAWYFLIRDDAPDAVSLDAAIEDVQGDSDNADGTALAGSGGSTSAADLTGEWTVDTESGDFDFDSATGSFVGFRIDEELSGIGSTTAVGRTGDVDGSLTVDGDQITTVDMEVNMDSLTTDESRRDGRARDALKTSEYPTATFALTDPITLPADAVDGDAVSIQANGDLTVAGVTQPVIFDVDAQLVNDTMVIVATTDVLLSDFDIAAPSAPIVLSVADEATVEMQLLMVRG
ncbi:MAG: YceI family protein [Actinobacteria bacterium]|nr:YceI family protein [Actinomycetota bacterium]MCB9388295.1 YceI family protein [Acidimicrobiia bacterium]